MGVKPYVLILFSLVLVLQTNSVLACGTASEKVTCQKSCCQEEDHSEKKSCCDTEKHDDKGCGGNCNSGSCHCSSPVSIPIVFNEFRVTYITNFFLLNHNWTYSSLVPKMVCLSIWQPPKIS